MNDRRRLLSSAVFVAVIALVFFLPHLFASPLILPLLSRQLTRQLPGQLEVQSCSFRWTGGLICRDVRYTDNQRALRLQLPQVSTDKGLLTLFVAPKYLGNVTLEQPTLVFLKKGAPLKKGEERRQAAQTPGQQLPVSWWEKRGLRFQLHGGRILTDQGTGRAPRVLARELSLSGDLNLGTVNYVLDLQNAQSAGQVHAQGFLNLPIAGQPFLASLVSRSTLDIHSMEIEPLLELAASRFPDIPLGRGLFNGVCSLDLAGIDNLVVKGQARINDLELHGGFLGKDQPRLRQAQLRFSGSRHPAEGWRLEQLELQSEPLSFSAQGLLDRQRVDFSGKGKADLPQLTEALPHFFAIHDQTRIHKGALSFAFQAKGPLERINLKADCDTPQLEVTQADHPYGWENPLALHAAAVLSPTGVHFNYLQFNAPFLTVQGQGGLEQFSLKATADLDHLFSELEKIFALNLHAKGRLAFSLNAQLLERNLTRLSGLLRIENFAVERGDQTLLPVHPLVVQGELTGRPWFLPRSGLQSVQLDLDGWPGTIALWGDRLQGPSQEQQGEVRENCRISTALDLQRLEQVIRILQGQKTTWGIKGLLQAEARGEWRQAVVKLRQLKGQIRNFVLFPGNTFICSEPQIDLSVEKTPLHLGTLNLGELQIVQGATKTPPLSDFCRIGLQPLRLDLRHLRLQTAQSIIDVQGFLGHRAKGQEAPVLSVRGLGDLHLLASWWRHMGWFDGRFDARGRALAAWTARPGTADRPQSTEFSLQVKDLLIKEGKKSFFEDPKAALEFELQPGGLDNQGTKIARVHVQASQFSFVGAGVAHQRENLPYLDLQGELQPGAALMHQVLQALVPGKVSLQEMQPGKVICSAPLHFPIDLHAVTLSGHLGAKRLRYLGIDLAQVVAAIDLNRSSLEMQIKGESEGGEIRLEPKWQQEGKGMLLRLQADSQVLRHLPITEPVANEFLPQLPPLGCLVQATGTMGLRINRFSLPVSAKRRQPDFAVVIDLAKARPKAVSALRQLLESAGLARQPLRFQERELICEGWNGSITCAPLRLKVGTQEVNISGSKRRNGQIAYRVELPVTKALASKAGLSAYGNFTAVAEITGQEKTPVFDQTTFFQGLAGQITAALPKPEMNTEGVPGTPEDTATQAASGAGN